MIFGQPATSRPRYQAAQPHRPVDKYSFTTHPGIVDFTGQSYLFLHNATLAIGDMSGAIGRRAVTMERLFYTPDGTMRPVIQS
jgi:arabinoxylan arabinofuranohydrolase